MARAEAVALSLKARWQGLHFLVRLEVVLTMIGLALTAPLALTGAPLFVWGFFLALFALVLPCLLIVLGLPVLVHELGHYAVARRSGMNVVGFNVLGVPFVRGAPPFHDQGEYFGFVLVRTTLDQDRPEIFVPFFAAGPLAGAVGALVEGVLWWIDAFGLGTIFGLQALFGLLLSGSSLLSRSPAGKGPRTDGEKMRDVREPDSQVFGMTAFRRITGSPESWDVCAASPEDVRRALRIRDPFLSAHAMGVACYRSIESSSPDALERCLDYLKACEKALAHPLSPEAQSQAKLLYEDAVFEVAFVQAHFHRDADAAEETMERLDRVEPSGFHNALRVDAAMKVAQGDVAAARQSLDEAWRHLRAQRLENPSAVWDLAESWLARVQMAMESAVAG